jgi:hypothetical protein
MTLALANKNWKNSAIGDFFLFPYPAVDPGISNAARLVAFMAMICADGTARRDLKAGVTPYGTMDEEGANFKVKNQTQEFTYNDGSPKEKTYTGVEEATVDFQIYEADPGHWADVWGCQPADLIAIAASTGKAARQAVLLGTPNNNTKYVAIFRSRSSLVPGEFDYYLWPRVSFGGDPDIKLSRKNKLQLKITMNVLGCLYLKATDGSPVFGVPEIATAPGL